MDSLETPRGWQELRCPFCIRDRRAMQVRWVTISGSCMEPTLPRDAVALECSVRAHRLRVGDVISFDLLGQPEIHRIAAAFSSRGHRHFICTADAGGAPLIVRDDQVFGRIELAVIDGMTRPVMGARARPASPIRRFLMSFLFLVYAGLHMCISRSGRRRSEGLEGARGSFGRVWRFFHRLLSQR